MGFESPIDDWSRTGHVILSADSDWEILNPVCKGLSLEVLRDSCFALNNSVTRASLLVY